MKAVNGDKHIIQSDVDGVYTTSQIGGDEVAWDSVSEGTPPGDGGGGGGDGTGDWDGGDETSETGVITGRLYQNGSLIYQDKRDLSGSFGDIRNFRLDFDGECQYFDSASFEDSFDFRDEYSTDFTSDLSPYTTSSGAVIVKDSSAQVKGSDCQQLSRHNAFYSSNSMLGSHRFTMANASRFAGLRFGITDTNGNEIRFTLQQVRFNNLDNSGNDRDDGGIRFVWPGEAITLNEVHATQTVGEPNFETYELQLFRD